MPLSFVALFFVFLLLYATKIPVAIAAARKDSKYDNHMPRDQQATLTGWGKRALSSHQNGFEGFAPFAAAVFMAHLTHADARASGALAMAYLGARVVYSVLYIADFASARSAVWFIGFLCTAALYVLPIFA